MSINLYFTERIHACSSVDRQTGKRPGIPPVFDNIRIVLQIRHPRGQLFSFAYISAIL